MNELELIVFKVGHGLSVALVEKPENYVSLIDLGAETDFSPLIYLAQERKLTPDILYITHPHGDHITDVDTALDTNFQPLSINYQDYDWDDVIQRERPELREKVKAYRKLISKVKKGTYGGSAKLSPWFWTPEKAKEIFGESAYINNSSLFIIYKWKDFKIAIAGDHHSDAMEKLAKYDKFKLKASDTYILIAPHHGHSQGFCPSWPQEVGKPFISIVSVQSRDPNVDTGYSSGDFAKGIKIGGKTRYVLTTRSDGNIDVSMWYDTEENPKWDFNFF